MVDVGVRGGLAVTAEALLERLARVAVQRRVFPSRWFVPIPARAITASV
jgi:hypothetical protein